MLNGLLRCILKGLLQLTPPNTRYAAHGDGAADDDGPCDGFNRKAYTQLPKPDAAARRDSQIVGPPASHIANSKATILRTSTTLQRA